MDKYTYLVIRTHGLKLRLIKRDTYIKLLGSTLDEFLNLLSNTDYSDVIERIKGRKLKASTFSKAIFSKYLQRINKLHYYAPKDLRSLIDLYALGRYEVENIKRLIRAIAFKERISENELHPVSLHFSIDELLNFLELESLISFLEEKGFEYTTRAYEIYNDNENPFIGIIECGIDADYFNMLHQYPIRNNGLRTIIDTESNLRWLYWCIIFKLKELSLSMIQDFMNVLNRNLKKNILHVAERSSLSDFLSIITHIPYYRGLEDLLGKAIREHDYALIEYALLHKLYSEAIKVMKSNFVDVSFIFAYILLCEMEMKNLDTIFIGKKVDLPSTYIQRLLYLSEQL